jgi:hypothetical protein
MIAIFFFSSSLFGLSMSTTFYSIGCCGETIVSSSTLAPSSCVETKRPSIIGSCGATICILDIGSCVPTSMLYVVVLVSFSFLDIN